MGVPYENATSGTKARDEINKILRRFGCDQIGWTDDERSMRCYWRSPIAAARSSLRPQQKAGRRCGFGRAPGRTASNVADGL